MIREKFIIPILILITVLGIEFQYIYNSLTVPENLVYLGSVHWPADYFYYLSQFLQGKNNWLTSTVLFTPETLKPVWVGWQNVLTGKILLFFGFDVITAYQVAVGVYLVIYLIISYFLIREVFQSSKVKRMLSFFFFVSSTSMFRILKTNGGSGWEFSYWTHWYNLGTTLGRFGPTPHHLIAYSLGTFILLITIIWVKNRFKSIKYGIFLSIAGFLQASISPVAWGLTTLAVFLTGAVFFILKKERKYTIAGIVLLLSGIFPSVYVKAVFSTLPYSLSSVWEAGQHIAMSARWLFYDSGLVVVLGLIGISGFLKKINFERLLILIFLSLAVFFYMSGVPWLLKISNARFWPSQVYIAWAILACEGVFFLSGLIPRYFKALLIFILLIYTGSILPTYYVEYRDFLKPMYAYGHYYMPKDIYEGIIESARISKENDVFLVLWPYNLSFPALTGRRVLFADPLLTINYEEKMRDGFSVIDGTMNEEELKKTLNKYRINYLLVSNGKSEYFKKFSFFQEKYSNSTVSIYKVWKL